MFTQQSLKNESSAGICRSFLVKSHERTVLFHETVRKQTNNTISRTPFRAYQILMVQDTCSVQKQVPKLKLNAYEMRHGEIRSKEILTKAV